MSTTSSFTNFRVFEPKERLTLVGLFIFLWVYLMVRSYTVFFITDEIETKWAYMVKWNPLPYMGYIDANNHFLNSFLGGLFYRIFNSDAAWIIRLPNILAFPLFFWSVCRLAPFFKQRIHFYALLASLVGSAFIIEYFALARGYGLSIAFFMAGLQFLLHYFRKEKTTACIGSILCLILAVYSNMSLVPLVLLAFAYLGLHLVIKKEFTRLTMVVIGLAPVLYAIQYAFHLKEIGKLYYGGEEGFFVNTVHSLSQYLWNVGHPFLDVFLSLIFLGIGATLLFNLKKHRSLFHSGFVLQAFCLAAVANILAQHYILGVKFPEDRAAIYLVLLFFGALFFSLDYWQKKWPSYLLIAIAIGHFVYDFNFSKSKFFYYEHFDEELISSIPDEVLGTPATTGARFWKMDNERMRQCNLNSFAFQNTYRDIDTLQDYIISTDIIRPDLKQKYHVKYQDPISKLTLYERDTFLKRQLIKTDAIFLDDNKEFFDFVNMPLEGPLLLRITGTLYDITDQTSFPIVVSTENTVRQEVDIYDGLNFLESCTVNERHEIEVDMSFAVGKNNGANLFKSYIWNPQKMHVSGQFKVEIYRLYN